MLFLIELNVDCPDQVPFIKALFDAFRKSDFQYVPRMCETTHTVFRLAEAWLALCKTRDWIHYKTLRKDLKFRYQSSGDGHETSLQRILDYTIALVGMQSARSFQTQTVRWSTSTRPVKKVAKVKQECSKITAWLTDHPEPLEADDHEWFHLLKTKVDRWAGQTVN